MKDEQTNVTLEESKKPVSRDKVVKNFSWRFLERVGAQGVNFIVELVLARILDPTHFGTLALVTVVLNVLQVFVDSGLGNALIQKKDADDLDFSSVFYFNMLVCTVLYVAVFFGAIPFAKIYDKPELVPVIRVMAVVLIISGLKNVQQAYVSRTMQFKRFFFATLVGTVIAAVMGIWMAYKGFGVWALVAQHVTNTAIDTLMLWFVVKWRPKKMFSWERLKVLLSYGWKLLVSKLIDTVYEELRQLLIGYFYTDAELSFYEKGKRYPHFMVTNINYAIDSVLFPALSKEQDDPERVRHMTSRAIKTSSYLLMPMMMGVGVCAESLVTILLTKKWLPCVTFLRLFCFSYAFYPIITANLSAIKALGRSDLALKIEIAKKTVGVALLFATIFISVKAVAYSLIAVSLCDQIINSWPNKKLMNYSYLDQIRDILPHLLLTVFMGACVYAVEFLGLGVWPTLLIQVPLGVLIYVGGSALFKIDSFLYLYDLAKGYLKKFLQHRKKA